MGVIDNEVGIFEGLNSRDQDVSVQFLISNFELFNSKFFEEFIYIFDGGLSKLGRKTGVSFGGEVLDGGTKVLGELLPIRLRDGFGFEFGGNVFVSFGVVGGAEVGLEGFGKNIPVVKEIMFDLGFIGNDVVKALI